MIKLFASDLDGTLLNECHTTDGVINKGIEYLKSQGRILAAATGRNRTMYRLSGLKDIYLVGLNGAAVVNDRDEILYQARMDKDAICQLVKTFPDLPLEFNTVDELFICQDGQTWAQSRSQEPGPFKPMMLDDDLAPWRHFNVSLDELLAKDIIKVNCMNPMDERSLRLEAFLDAHRDQLVNASSYPWIYEITATGVTKAGGIRKLAEILGIAEDEVAVYGDGGNDLDMLQAFAHSYAPENGSPLAQQAASEVIGHNEEYSVIRHMMKTVKEEG